MKTKTLLLTLLFGLFSFLSFSQETKVNSSPAVTMQWWNGLDKEWQLCLMDHAKMTFPIDSVQLEKVKDILYLLLGEYNIKDLTPLIALPQLMYVNCSNTKITSLEPLRYLTNMTVFACDSVPVEDLRPLYCLPNLVKLSLIGGMIPKEKIDALRIMQPKTELFLTKESRF